MCIRDSRYSADLNQDGATADLLYVPASPSEITFTDFRTGTGSAAVVKYTAQQQSDAFFAYIEQDDYLRTRKGQYAERNGALLPWLNRFDFKLLQDFGFKVGNTVQKFQFSVDVLNIGNLLSSKWGVAQRLNVANAALLRPTVAANGTVTYQLVETSGALPTRTFVDNVTINNTWGAQLGLRYLFN